MGVRIPVLARRPRAFGAAGRPLQVPSNQNPVIRESRVPQISPTIRVPWWIRAIRVRVP